MARLFALITLITAAAAAKSTQVATAPAPDVLALLEELAGRADIRSDPLLSGPLARARSRIVAGDTGSDYADDSGTEN